MSPKRKPTCNLDCFHCIHPDCIRGDIPAHEFRDRSNLQQEAQPQEPPASYYEANRAEILAKSRLYYEEHRAERLEKDRAYYYANRAAILERQRVYRTNAQIKRRIRAGQLVGYEFREDFPGVGECLLLIFKSEPICKTVPPSMYVEYVDILAHWNRYNGGGEPHERNDHPEGSRTGDAQQPPLV